MSASTEFSIGVSVSGHVVIDVIIRKDGQTTEVSDMVSVERAKAILRKLSNAIESAEMTRTEIRQSLDAKLHNSIEDAGYKVEPAVLVVPIPKDLLVESLKDLRSAATPRVEWREDHIDMAREAIRAMRTDIITVTDRIIDSVGIREFIEGNDF